MSEENCKTLFLVESTIKAKSLHYILNGKFKGEFKVFATRGRILDIPPHSSCLTFNNGAIRPLLQPLQPELYERLQRNIAWADYVYIATDNDFEGESIAAQIAEISLGKQYSRVYFNVMDYNHILSSISRSQDINYEHAQKAEAQRLFDRLLACSGSYKTKVHSPGRVKSPLLKSIRECINSGKNKTHRIVKTIKSSPYGNTTASFYINAHKVSLEQFRCDIQALDEPEVLLDTSSTTHVFNTYQSLQAITHTYGISVKKAAEELEHLYLNGKISYPRTESTAVLPSSLSLLKKVHKDYSSRPFYLPPTPNTIQEGMPHEAIFASELDTNMMQGDNISSCVYRMILEQTLKFTGAIPSISHLFPSNRRNFRWRKLMAKYGAFLSLSTSSLEFGTGTSVRDSDPVTDIALDPSTLVLDCMFENSIARPSTYAHITESICGTFLRSDLRLTPNALKHLNLIATNLPMLLDQNTGYTIDTILSKNSSTIADRVTSALRHVGLSDKDIEHIISNNISQIEISPTHSEFSLH